MKLTSKEIQVAVYYFPNYHPDPRNAEVHGPGWSEWELARWADTTLAPPGTPGATGVQGPRHPGPLSPGAERNQGSP